MTDSHPADVGSGQARAHLAATLIAVGAEDHAAFRELYRLTSAKLFGITLRICCDRHAAEEVLQDVYLTIWRRGGAWEPGRASPITWLATIARNRAIDWRRSQGVVRSVLMDDAPELVDTTPNAEAAMVAGGELSSLLTCLSELEPRQRDAIRTAFFDGVTYVELARRAEVPEGTAKSWIRRGLQRLKECLQRGG